ncbi:MAG: Lpg1974 family pore-forming outer membrane protein [Chlamydiota bacterium]
MKGIFWLFPFAFSIAFGAEQAPTPPDKNPRPTLQNFRDFNTFTSLDFTYWKFTAPRLAFGRDGVGVTNTPVPQEIAIGAPGTVFLPNYKYTPGYRVGLGFRFGTDKAYDLTARYIWFYTNPKRDLSQDHFSGPFLPVNWLASANLNSSTYRRANVSFQLHYHLSEVQSGYTFGVSRFLSLRPYMALTNYILDATYHLRYEFTDPMDVFEIAIKETASFAWSLGPKIGLDFSWLPTKYFGIYCNVSWTHQAVQLSMHTKQTNWRPGFGEPLVIQRGKSSQLRSASGTGLEIGPTWDQWFAQDRYHLQWRVTWQTSTLPETYVSLLNSNNTDLGLGIELRGVNFRALFEF